MTLVSGDMTLGEMTFGQLDFGPPPLVSISSGNRLQPKVIPLEGTPNGS